MAGKKGALDKTNPKRIARDCSMAEKRAEGKSYSQLAKEFGISKSRVGQILRQDEIKEILDETTKQLVSLVPLAMENVIRTLLDKNEKALAYKASTDLLKTIGVAPSHVNNPIINKYYTQENNVVLSDGVAKLLSKTLIRKNEDLIDIEDTDCADED